MINNKIINCSFFLEKKLSIIKIKLNTYGILWIKHKLQGWNPRTYSIKKAEIIDIKLNKKITFK